VNGRTAAMVLSSVRRALERGDPAASRLLPPLVQHRRGSSVILGYPGGRLGRPVVKNAFLLPAAAPWRKAFSRLERFAFRHREWYGLLRPENGRVHGVCLRTVYGVAVLAREERSGPIVQLLVCKHLQAMGLLLRRLKADFGGAALIRDLEVLPGDPHRGGQFTVRVALRDGKTFVYKARSVEAERLLFGRGGGSLAELANHVLAREGRPERLPLLDVRRGSGRYGRHYGYIGWVDAAPHLRPMRCGSFQVRAVRATGIAARRLWKDAGLLAAFAHWAGIADLHQDNLVVGCGHDGALRYHPVDAEFFGVGFNDLESTLLLRASIRQGHQSHLHAGFECECQPCGREADQWGFYLVHGSWRLQRIKSGVPEVYASLVFDRRNRIGYRPYLTDFLSGLLSGCDLISRHGDDFRALLRRGSRSCLLRHIVRATRIYWDELRPRLAGPARPGGRPRMRPSELKQLQELDIPYFVRRGRGQAAYYYDPYPSRLRRAGPLPAVPRAAAGPKVLRPEHFPSLLQDALDHVLLARAPILVKANGLSLRRRRGSHRTEFEGTVRNGTWTVNLDSRRGVAGVTVIPRSN
jgi:hypothetical protein